MVLHPMESYFNTRFFPSCKYTPFEGFCVSRAILFSIFLPRT